MSISISNLTKCYGEQKAVNNISFSLKKGEIVGFLGPNGAGKSTTMKIITGFLSQDEGDVQVCDIDVHKNQIASKEKIGYLPEANPLYMDMFVREYLGFLANIHRLKKKKERIDEVIALVGLNPEAHKKIGALSKGYKQRVGLAAALIHNPEVLILDEPTSGLDPNQIVEIRQVIKKLGEQKTILFSSHIMQEVEAICERVIIINKGQIVADDLLQNLKKATQRKEYVIVSFEKDVKQDILNGIPYVEAIEKISDNTFRFNTGNPEKLKKEILKISLEKDLNILTIQSTSENLEEIFKTLTT